MLFHEVTLSPSRTSLHSLRCPRSWCKHWPRTLSILCFPALGVLASEVLGPIEPKLVALKKSLPPGYQLQIGGEKAKQVDGFTNLAVVLLISLVGIYLALLIQFNNAVKPLLVFAAASMERLVH